MEAQGDGDGGPSSQLQTLLRFAATTGNANPSESENLLANRNLRESTAGSTFDKDEKARTTTVTNSRLSRNSSRSDRLTLSTSPDSTVTSDPNQILASATGPESASDSANSGFCANLCSCFSSDSRQQAASESDPMRQRPPPTQSGKLNPY